MAIRPLTEEEKQKAAELTSRIEKDLQELYDLLAPNVSYRDFCQMVGNLRQKGYDMQRALGDVRKIREFLDELPGSQDLLTLYETLEKFRV